MCEDLAFKNLDFASRSGSLVASLLLEPNEWKHDEGLLLEYREVVAVELVVAEEPPLGGNRLDGMRVDEVTPDPRGFRHEMLFNRGSLVIVASELEATWGDFVR